MEAMAVVAAQYALEGSPSFDMSVLCRNANTASQWINRQRVATTGAQMQYFKGKRHILFKQWEAAFRGPARDHMGQFRSKRVAETSQSGDVSRQETKKRKSKLDDYGDIFSGFHCTV